MRHHQRRARGGPCGAALALLLGALLAGSASAQLGNANALAQPCPGCKAVDWQNSRCCPTGLKCVMFAGQGFGTPPVVKSMCLPEKPQGCGTEGGPCCLGQNVNGFLTASCGAGLSCVTGALPWASKAMFDKLSSSGGGALKSAAVVGTCQRFTAQQCGKAYMPCGKDIAAAGVACPGNPASCPSGFYCASVIDAGVGERCLPIPKNAGQPGGPCLPNNLPNAPLVDPKKTGKNIAPPFCPGSAVCFTQTLGDRTGLTFDQPDKAKSLASRLTGTLCVTIPADCGKRAGAPCCPSDYGAVTDKPLPGYEAGWGGFPCDATKDKYGLYCSGNYAWLSGEPLGKCAANVACGSAGQPCCSYSRPDMGGLSCPGLKPSSGYCTLQNSCRVCPKVLDIVEDLLRCY